jgi:hypothetical protein
MLAVQAIPSCPAEQDDLGVAPAADAGRRILTATTGGLQAQLVPLQSIASQIQGHG